ncbi:MAG TPA: TerC family protein [Gammaproteobacteria bacterium]|nr:TerC family protein [Gammaproteobacteria bacterium]
MEWITDPQAWAALLTLTALEIVLGIDNIIFLTILTGRLPAHQQPRARTVGLAAAMLTRLALLVSLAWLARLSVPLFSVLDRTVSVRDLVLIGGGLFLLAKSTMEIHQALEGGEEAAAPSGAASFVATIVQIMVLDVVFSLDSVITAIGMARDIAVMATAIVIAVFIMMGFAGPVSRFIDRHPTVKMLALSFLLMIGIALIAEGLDFEIPKGYIYFAMAFSVFVEMLNLRIGRRGAAPVHLHQARLEGDASAPEESDPS